jgi:hypothetical protein
MYVPMLKWKQGEYQALLRLDPAIKNNVTPFVDIPPIGWDFEEQRLKKTVDDHLMGFGKKLKIKWGKKPIFIDLVLLGQNERMSNDKHPVEYIFSDARDHSNNAIPVTAFDRDTPYQMAVKNVVDLDKNGLCIRLSFSDLVKGDTDLKLISMTEYLGVAISNIDIVLDLVAPSFQPLSNFVTALRSAILSIKNIQNCRSFTIAATAFPETMGGLNLGENLVDRGEWQLFYEYRSLISDREKQPQFGDYTISHPDVVNLDMRYIKPAASLRYTIDDMWLIVKGRNVRDYKFRQYVEMCQLVVNSGHFANSDYSMGDKYIYDCSEDNESTGTLTTWRWVGVNHHITKVVNDLANLHVL